MIPRATMPSLIGFARLTDEQRREYARRAAETRRKTNPNGTNAFWKHVPFEPFNVCWEWLGPRTPLKLRPSKTGRSFNGGYGQTSYRGRSMHAHRAAWLIHQGGEIPPNIDVCHKCDNRLCVNPAHLFLGTRYENILDCKLKGRHRGHNGAGKLSRENVEEILRETMNGVSGTELARRFNVSHCAIYPILAGEKHKEVPRPEGFFRPSREAWRKGQCEKQRAALLRVQSILHTCECGRVIKGNAIGYHRIRCQRERGVVNG